MAQDWPGWATAILWVVFSIYWEIAAENSSTAASGESGASRQVHVFLVNVALLLILLPVPGLRGRYLPSWGFIVIAGLAIQVAGVLLAVWARRHLGKHWSGQIAIKVGHELVRTGPYRYLRHPIYTALLAMYLGSAVVWGEWHALIGLGVGLIAYLRKMHIEEQHLMEAFESQYEKYRADTFALFPGIF